MSSHVELTLAADRKTSVPIEEPIAVGARSSYCGRFYSHLKREDKGWKCVASISLVVIGGIFLTMSSLNLINDAVGGHNDYYSIPTYDQDGDLWWSGDVSSETATPKTDLIMNITTASIGALCVSVGIVSMIKMVGEALIATSERENLPLLG